MKYGSVSQFSSVAWNFPVSNHKNYFFTFFFLSEEGKLSTSQDASCKYVVEEVVEEAPSALQPANSGPEQR